MARELICIICPNGCNLSIDENLHVTGNKCLRGEQYAKNELTNPVRSLSSTVKLVGSDSINVLPVRSSKPLPKSEIFNVMKEINNVTIHVPVHIGQIIISNVLNLGVDIIASRGVEK